MLSDSAIAAGEIEHAHIHVAALALIAVGAHATPTIDKLTMPKR